MHDLLPVGQILGGHQIREGAGFRQIAGAVCARRMACDQEAHLFEALADRGQS